MKKQLLQLLICALSLVFVATVAKAYTPPVSAPGNGNSDAPLNVSAVNQSKTGGLTVGTFQARNDSYFDQNVYFDGLIRGGTVNSPASTPVTFGGPANKVDVSFTGTASINGVYQSDSLKTGGGLKPLCANQNGTVYLCAAAPVAPPPPAVPIHVLAQYQTFNPSGASNGTLTTLVVAVLTQPVSTNVTAQIVAVAGGNNSLGFLKNFYTADAKAVGVCQLTSNPTTIGTFTIFAGTTNSSQSNGGGAIALPSGCSPLTTSIYVTTYSPHTTPQGVPIIAN